jgi:hypothetical protein
MVMSSVLLFGLPIAWLFNQHASRGNVPAEIEINAFT